MHVLYSASLSGSLLFHKEICEIMFVNKCKYFMLIKLEFTMKKQVITAKDVSIAIIQSEDILISDVQSALDLIATVSFVDKCHRIILNKDAIIEDFFILSTNLAGEVLQKFSNYHIKLAIIGDFSSYTSKPLKDFIYECNRGNSIFFVSSEEEGIEKLAKV